MITLNRQIQYGMAPRKISLNEPSSGTAAFTVNTSMPNGGVSKPVSMASMPSIAKASGSIPNAAATGANTGTVSRMIEIESISMPRMNQISTITANTPQKPSPDAMKKSLAIPVTPVIDSTRE